MADPQKPSGKIGPEDIPKIVAALMVDGPKVSALYSAVVKLVVDEKNASSFAERVKLSEPVIEAVAEIADLVKAQVESVLSD